MEERWEGARNQRREVIEEGEVEKGKRVVVKDCIILS